MLNFFRGLQPQRVKTWAVLLGISLAILSGGCARDSGATISDPATVAERKAVALLTREVPAWSRDNRCFACHNNGDAARALFAASLAGYKVPGTALADTTTWLKQPAQWSHNKGDPGFSDQRLANLQFATSLFAAQEAGFVRDRTALREAARLVAIDQDKDGAWNIERQNPVGSPATWGTTLATRTALKILRAADASEYRNAVVEAQQWLRQVRPGNIPVAAALLLAASDVPDRATVPQWAECLALIRRAQTSDGGWGPYMDSPAESFDTALVLLALTTVREVRGVDEVIRRGRDFLAREQMTDGSWPATTRPSGGQSYAQQMSTTGWATLALLATRRDSP